MDGPTTAEPAPDACGLCGRNTNLEFHHLIPRTNHNKPWFRRQFTREEMRTRGAMLCRLCHRFIHRQWDEQTLGRRLNTLDALRDEPATRRHVRWAQKQRVARPR